MEWIKQSFSIIGIARSGLAAAEKIKKAGGHVFLSDSKPMKDVVDGEKINQEYVCEFAGHSDKVLESDVIILSPGVPQTIPIIQKAKNKGIYVISEIEFAYRMMNKESKIIAVTGSNGKSTSVSLIYHLLKTAGYKTLLAGNIGDAFSSFDIENKYDWIVLELSSFQLELIDTFKADVSVITNITPDHLNRYDSFDDYALAKFNIFKNQTVNEKAVIFADDDVIERLKKHLPQICEYYSMKNELDAYYRSDLDQIVLKKDTSEFVVDCQKLKIRGPHNYCNVMCALLSVKDIIKDDAVLYDALYSFTSLEHRLEPVGTVNGVHFINDSKATNTDSVKYALLSFPKPIRLIMGGSDKGEDFSILNDLIKKNAKKLYLIGATKDIMIKAYQNIIEIETFSDFEDAITKAYTDSEEGDFVVLSPACASYDMFQNFEHRGKTFKEIVRKLK